MTGGSAIDVRALPGAPGRLYVPIRDGRGTDGLPFSLRVLLENVLRQQVLDGIDRQAEVATLLERRVGAELGFRPARVFGQDILGTTMLLDMAALRDAVAAAGGDPAAVVPNVPVDVIVDHSLQVDVFGRPDAAARNMAHAYRRGSERFAFLRWCQGSFGDRIRVVPLGKGIMHQIHLEHLGDVVRTEPTAAGLLAIPDTVVGTDSHTPMINALGILGWGVGGIEAEAVMLGRAISLAMPAVVGVEVSGRLPEGATPTDLVLTVTEKLRGLGVVGKFVEFFGRGLEGLSLPDRGTIANMAPEYGATCVFFPVDRQTVDYLRMTGRPDAAVRLVEAYMRTQGMWREESSPYPDFESTLRLDLGTVRPCIAGPRNPEGRIDLAAAASSFPAHVRMLTGREVRDARTRVGGAGYAIADGDVVIAAITSCTNTSNPEGMATAGLVARNAVARGLAVKPWVKTSLAPGSQVVAAALERAGLQGPLDALGFNIVGFGCTTCNGMSGPLPTPIAEAIESGGVAAAAVLSGNRNFEGRVHPLVRAAYLASPALVVAYALAGTVRADLTSDPLGHAPDGTAVRLSDLWPARDEVAEAVAAGFDPDLFRSTYAALFDGDETWDALPSGRSTRFGWDSESTYIRRPPFFDSVPPHPPAVTPVLGARPLAILGDSVTTDHISPSGAIAAGSAAARYLKERGVEPADFDSYSTRRGNHEVVMRATFASIRLRNAMVPGREGSVTTLQPDGRVMPIFDAALEYARRAVPLIVVAGRDYGCGSSRDSAAKGVALLGVKAVIAKGFERIHRSNLVGMGVLPLEFGPDDDAESLGLDGTETFDLPDLPAEVAVRGAATCVVRRADTATREVRLRIRLDTTEELAVWREGGILPAVWREKTELPAT